MKELSYAEIHDRALLECAAPSAIVDNKQNLVHMSKRAARFIRLNDNTKNIIALVPPELRFELRTALDHAQQYGTSKSANKAVTQTNELQTDISLSVKYYEDEETSNTFFLITFNETHYSQDNSINLLPLNEDVAFTNLEAELQHSHKQLQETIERSKIVAHKLMVSNEKLRSTTAELENSYEMSKRNEIDRAHSDFQHSTELAEEQAFRSNAERKCVLKDEFIAIMSHELRHPLNIIHINAELLSRTSGFMDLPANAKAMNSIQNSVKVQTKIIEDLLEMSRFNTGKLTIHRTEVCLCNLVKSIVDTMRLNADSKKITIIFESKEHSLPINADIIRIEQVVLNLLGNALKFTPESGKITVRISRENNKARLDVIDTGKGIAADFLSHVFDMFGQAIPAANSSIKDRKLNENGLGIGLALVRHIVELHDGKVQVKYRGLGYGSQFTVWLPAISTGVIHEKSSGINSTLNGVRILFADNTADMLSLFKDLLEMHGASVFTVTNTADKLNILKQQKIDIIISDISISETDSYEFIKTVRTQPELINIPAIAISSPSCDKDSDFAIAAGFSGHICKPVSIDKLCSKITELQLSSQ